MAVPSLIVCGVVFSLAPPTNQWPWLAETVFAFGTVSAVISLAWLGNNFAVFPALRSVTVSGPYSLIRHPAYAGEMLLVFACCLAAATIEVIVASLFLLPLIVLRILVEERLLAKSIGYVHYLKSVRWRLFPGVW